MKINLDDPQANKPILSRSVEPGIYDARIVFAGIEKANLQVVYELRTGATVMENFPLFCSNPAAQAVARKTLVDLCHAIGISGSFDTDDLEALYGKILTIKVEAGDYKYPFPRVTRHKAIEQRGNK